MKKHLQILFAVIKRILRLDYFGNVLTKLLRLANSLGNLFVFLSFFRGIGQEIAASISLLLVDLIISKNKLSKQKIVNLNKNIQSTNK